MENILVTGGAGYVGSVLVRKLLAYGFKVTVFDNLFKDGKNLTPLLLNPDFTFVKGDVTDRKQLENLAKKNKFDGVIGLAALVGEPICKKYPSLAKAVNYNGVVNTRVAFQDSKFIMASTGSVYGNIPDGLCVETLSPNPLSVYG